MKAVVVAFNQEKALVGAFSVITNLRMELFQALDYSLVHTGAATPLGSEQCMLRAFWHSICCKRKRMILVIQERIMSQSAAAALRIPDTRKHINTRVERLPQTRFLKICMLADSWCLSTDERMSLEMDCTYHLLTGKVFRPWAASWAWHQCPESWWCCNLWPKLVWGGQQWAARTEHVLRVLQSY